MPISIRARSAWYALVIALLVPLANACEDNSLKPQPVPEPSELFWDLMLSEHAVTLAMTPPYDTLTVVAIPRNYHGETLTGLPRPRYQSLNPSVVSITSDGVLTAVAAFPDSIARVIASLTVNDLLHADTLLVRVADDPSPQDHRLETFSIHPLPPDSAKWGAAPDPQDYAFRLLNTLVRATYVGGAPVPTTNLPLPSLFGDGFTHADVSDVLVSIRSSDTTRAVIDRYDNDVGSLSSPTGIRPLTLRGMRPGDIQLYASATVFGVKKADTLPFRVGFPLSQHVEIQPITEGASVNFFVQRSIILGTGGVVVWENATANPTDVTFDDPTHAAAFNTTSVPNWAGQMSSFWCPYMPYFSGEDCTAAGNFTSLGSSGSVTGNSLNMRTFPVPGVYGYHNAQGLSGRITVSGD